MTKCQIIIVLLLLTLVET